MRRVQLTRSARLLGSLAVLAVALTACSSATSSAGVTSGPAAPTADAKATFTGHGSIGQAYVLGAPPGTHLVLANAAGTEVGSGTADGLGSLIIRNVTPAAGYTFRSVDGQKVEATSSFEVLTPSDTPPASFYSSQHLSAGLNYITMRDGVKLAATVRLPPGKTLSDGPFPTVLEESGYAIAAPHSLIDAELHQNGETTSDPLVPDTATAVGSLIAPLLGFATVSLQMRGTGCSGGRSICSICPPPTTATTQCRSSPHNRGLPTTRSAWWGSRSRASPRCSSPAPSPPGWPRSRR